MHIFADPESNLEGEPSGQHRGVQQTVTVCCTLLYLMLCILDDTELLVPVLITSLFCS